MADPFISLLGLPAEISRQSTSSSALTEHTCSVTKIGSCDDVDKWSGPVARHLVNIHYIGSLQSLNEESMQRTLARIVYALARVSEDGESSAFLPFFAVLERSPGGACYTMLCRYGYEEALELQSSIVYSMFRQLVFESGLDEDCLRTVSMDMDGLDELAHLLTRTWGRGPGMYPIERFPTAELQTLLWPTPHPRLG
jgi:hypothetical protein